MFILNLSWDELGDEWTCEQSNESKRGCEEEPRDSNDSNLLDAVLYTICAMCYTVEEKQTEI